MITKEPLHSPNCPNTRLVCRARMGTDQTSLTGTQVLECWEECLSCGARTPSRLTERLDERKAA